MKTALSRSSFRMGAVVLLFACFTLVANAAACVSPPSSLVSWWPGDGNALDIAGGHNGTLQNGATFAPGMVDQAFNFDGVDDHVSVFNNSSLTANGAFTIELWAKFNHVPRDSDFTNSMFLLEKNPEYVLYWRPDANALELDIADDCDGLFHFGAYTHLPTLQAGEFHHFAVTALDRGRGMHPDIHFFFDGIDLGSNPNSNLEGCGWNIAAAAELRIGARTDQWGGPMAFNGLLDEVSFYNRVLAASEIQAIYNADSEGKCKPLNYRLPFKGLEVITAGPGCGKHKDTPHEGQGQAIDYALDKDTTVVASERGDVVYADWRYFKKDGTPDTDKSFGRVVQIKHPDGTITTYAHLEAFAVTKGQPIGRGEPIGTSGNSGDVKKSPTGQGYHLHFDRREGAQDTGNGYHAGGIGIDISQLPTTILTGCTGTADGPQP